MVKKASKKDYRGIGMTDLIAIFPHTDVSFREWAKSEGMPSHKGETNKNLYDTIKVHNFLLDRHLRKVIGEPSPEDESAEPSDQLERFRKWAADTKKFDLSVKKGDYILKEQILLDLRLLVTHARKQFQMVSKELAFKLSTETDIKIIEDIIDHRIIEILEGISLSNIPNDEIDEE